MRFDKGARVAWVVLLSLTWTLVSACGGGGGGSTPATATVSGRVTVPDSAGGIGAAKQRRVVVNAVSRAGGRALTATSLEATTDDNGDYSIGNVPTGQLFVFQVVASGSNPKLEKAVNTSGNATANIGGGSTIAAACVQLLVAGGSNPNSINTTTIDSVEKAAAPLATSTFDYSDQTAVNTAAQSAGNTAEQDFNGNWSGTFTGSNTGTWQLNLANGTMTGTVVVTSPAEDAGTSNVTGSYEADGRANWLSNGSGEASLTGSFNRDGSASGTWQDSFDPNVRGTWQGHKQ